RPLSRRLRSAGETVIDVPAKLSARVRVFDTGNARKTDPVDAHAVAMAALRTPKLPRTAAVTATRRWRTRQMAGRTGGFALSRAMPEGPRPCGDLRIRTSASRTES